MDLLPEYYPESDDSYLLTDSLLKDSTWLRERFANGCFSVEVGPGSGYVSKAFLGMTKDWSSPRVHLAIDVNPSAASATMEECKPFQPLECVLGDMLSFTCPSFQPDLIFCNPPYVPSSPINRARDIRASYAGGERGREFIDDFLPVVAKRLPPHGVLYLLLELRNDVPEVLQIAQSQYALTGTLVMDRKIRGEHLFVYRFVRQ